VPASAVSMSLVTPLPPPHPPHHHPPPVPLLRSILPPARCLSTFRIELLPTAHCPPALSRTHTPRSSANSQCQVFEPVQDATNNPRQIVVPVQGALNLVHLVCLAVPVRGATHTQTYTKQGAASSCKWLRTGWRSSCGGWGCAGGPAERRRPGSWV
jgi:hypothetical protein